MQKPPAATWNWRNIVFLVSVHAAAAAGLTMYLVLHGASLAALVVFAVWIAATIFGISAGYHRLFSHRAYEASWPMRLFVLLFGAAAFENSAIEWAADHRLHHARVDTDEDPYNVRRGFWYAHVGWVLQDFPVPASRSAVPDLRADALVRWQGRHYVPIAVFMSFVLPALIGLLVGDFWGCLVMAGPVRVALVYQATFLINSFTHTFGSQPYSDANSSRDSFVAALITMGEGYHNFHHAFPSDYRNGVRGYQFDPTKWIIRALSVVKVTYNLKRTPLPKLYRARIDMDQRRLEARHGANALPHQLVALRQRFDHWVERWSALRAAAGAAAAGEAGVKNQNHALPLREKLREVQRELRATYVAWRRSLSIVSDT
jgi:stearoyl-CoA desaturase (delta-9 desaturase)